MSGSIIYVNWRNGSNFITRPLAHAPRDESYGTTLNFLVQGSVGSRDSSGECGFLLSPRQFWLMEMSGPKT